MNIDRREENTLKERIPHQKQVYSRDLHSCSSVLYFFLKISNPEPGVSPAFGGAVTPVHLALPAG